MTQRTEDNANTKQQMKFIHRRQKHEETTEDIYIERSNKDATNKTNQKDKSCMSKFPQGHGKHQEEWVKITTPRTLEAAWKPIKNPFNIIQGGDGTNHPNTLIDTHRFSFRRASPQHNKH